METIRDRKRLEAYIDRRGVRALFSGEPPKFLLRRYAPGELLTTPFSPSECLQFIVDGELLLYDMPDEESTVMLQTTYNEVRLLGDVELVNAKFTPFFVEAKTEVYTLAVPLERYRDELLNDPVFLQHLCRSLANKLNGAVVSHQQLPLRTRVSKALMHAEIGDCVTEIGHLARTLDVSTRQLIRVLNAFCAEGVLEHRKKGVYRVLKKPEK